MSILKVNQITDSTGTRSLLRYNSTTGQILIGDSAVTGNLAINVQDVTVPNNLAVVTQSTTSLLRISNSLAFNRDTPRVVLDFGDSTDSILMPRGTDAQRPSSPLAGMLRYSTTSNVFEVYNGTEWKQISTVVPLNGGSAGAAGTSAAAIKALTGTTTDQPYWITVNGTATQLYCLMSGPNSGGWMMLMKATRGGTFPYDSGYWTDTSTLNVNQFNRNDGDAKFNSFNYSNITDLLVIFPDVGNGNYGCDANAGYGFTWRDNGRLSNESARSWFGRVNNAQTSGNPRDGGICWWGSGSGIWSAQGGFQWAGYNYTANGSNKVRMGFAWNNEGDQSSNDVSGGLGMNRQSWSAGDTIGCCQTTTGMNRNCRFEMFGR